MCLGGEEVVPAKIIPIVHMKGDGHEVFPQSSIVFQLRQPRLRRRTTAASFGGVKFEKRRLRRSALKCDGIGAHELRAGDEQNAAGKQERCSKNGERAR